MMDIIIENWNIILPIIISVIVSFTIYKIANLKKDKANENEINLLICKINTIYQEVYHIIRHSGRDNEEILAIDCELRDYYRSSNKNMMQLIDMCHDKMTNSVFMNKSYNSSKRDLEKSVKHLIWLHERFTPSSEELELDDLELDNEDSPIIPWLDLLDAFEDRKNKLYLILEKKQIV